MRICTQGSAYRLDLEPVRHDSPLESACGQYGEFIVPPTRAVNAGPRIVPVFWKFSYQRPMRWLSRDNLDIQIQIQFRFADACAYLCCSMHPVAFIRVILQVEPVLQSGRGAGLLLKTLWNFERGLIMVPFWVLIIFQHLVFRGPKRE